MRMVVRCSRYGVHLVGLLAALMAVSACAIAGPVEGPVHVRCLWQLDEEADLDDFGGFWAGVLLEETAEQPELAVVWSLDDQAFWPLWRIQLVARRGVLTGDGEARAPGAVGYWSGMEALTIVGGPPTPGHQYEVCLSLDQELGGLSVTVEDITTGRQVAATSVAVSVRRGPLHLAAGLLAEAEVGEKASAQVIQIESGYAPWGVRWHVAAGETPLPTLHLERTDDARSETRLTVIPLGS